MATLSSISCLENPTDRGEPDGLIVHGVAKSRTQLSDFHSLTHLKES